MPASVRLKMETHAARWGLLRGCSSKATKWVDFVVADSTRRESRHLLRVMAFFYGVKEFVPSRREGLVKGFWLRGGFQPLRTIGVSAEKMELKSHLSQRTRKDGQPA